MSRRLRYLVAAIVTIMLVISLLPFGIKALAERQTRALGLGELAIENVDFNPFTLHLVIDNYALEHEGVPHLQGRQLALDLVWRSLLSGQIDIEEIALTGGKFWARETAPGEWAVFPAMQDTSVETADGPGEPILFNLSALAITDTTVHIEGEHISGELHLPNFDLNDLANFDSGRSDTQTQISAKWGDAVITVNANKALMAEKPPFSAELEIVGLALEDFRAMAGLPALSGRLDATFAVTGSLSRSPLIMSDAPLNLVSQTDVTLSISDLTLQDPSETIDVSVEKTEWQGQVEVTSTDGELAWLLGGDLNVNALKAMQGDAPLASFALLEATGIEIDADQSIAVAGVTISEVVADITINEEGKLIPVMEESGEAQEEAEIESESQRPRFLLGQFNASGMVNISDYSITPSFEQSITFNEIFVGQIDSERPAAATEIRVRARLDEYSTISIDSQAAPLSDINDLEATISVKQIPLGPISGYLARSTGYEVKRGQLDLTSEISLKDEHVEADIDVLLRRFEIQSAGDSSLENELGMPLGAALDLVRDSDNNIKLNDIKISGDLNNPNVSLQQLIARSVSKALLAGTMSYFKFALQPYGAALMAAEMIGAQAGKVRLDPMMMTPQSATIAVENENYAERLVTLLTERPGLHLVICGEASTATDIQQPAPGTALETDQAEAGLTDHTPMLTRLADERSALVKKTLFEKGIESERLLICKSSLNDDPTGARVVLGIE